VVGTTPASLTPLKNKYGKVREVKTIKKQSRERRREVYREGNGFNSSIRAWSDENASLSPLPPHHNHTKAVRKMCPGQKGDIIFLRLVCICDCVYQAPRCGPCVVH